MTPTYEIRTKQKIVLGYVAFPNIEWPSSALGLAFGRSLRELGPKAKPEARALGFTLN